MKIFILYLFPFLFIGANSLYSQNEQLATTDRGVRVILYPDGTWSKLGEQKPELKKDTIGTKEACYIKTGLMTRLLNKPNPFATSLTTLPQYKEYKVLKRHKHIHVAPIYFFYIEDKESGLSGWVKAGLELEFTHSNCLEDQ